MIREGNMVGKGENGAENLVTGTVESIVASSSAPLIIHGDGENRVAMV